MNMFNEHTMRANMRVQSPRVLHLAVTAVLALGAAFSGAACLALAEPIRETFQRLGLPLPLAGLVGGWKLLGAAALLLPGRPRLREWAHAGFAFLFSGAVFLHLAAGDSLAATGGPLLLLALALVASALDRPDAPSPVSKDIHASRPTEVGA